MLHNDFIVTFGRAVLGLLAHLGDDLLKITFPVGQDLGITLAIFFVEQVMVGGTCFLLLLWLALRVLSLNWLFNLLSFCDLNGVLGKGKRVLTDFSEVGEASQITKF